MQITEPLPPRDSYTAGQGPKTWISNKIPGDVDAAGLGTILVQENLWDQEMTRKISGRDSRHRLLQTEQGAGQCPSTEHLSSPARAQTFIWLTETCQAPTMCAQEGNRRKTAPTLWN